MTDPYVYEGSSVLKNLLDITESKTLDLVEAEQSRANMMLLYEAGFNDFSTQGLQYVHKYLFGDIYEWAGQFRVINIQKREKVLAGASVWYSYVDAIETDLDAVWHAIHSIDWPSLHQSEFVEQLVGTFPLIWKAHPFREGNTRAIVMMMTLFIENHGHYGKKSGAVLGKRRDYWQAKQSRVNMMLLYEAGFNEKQVVRFR